MGTVAKQDHGFTLEYDDDGNVVARYTYKTYRFLFESGKVIDVYAVRNDSWLAEDLLALTKEVRIVGTTEVPDIRQVVEQPAMPTKPLKDPSEITHAPVKKTAAKKVAATKKATPRKSGNAGDSKRSA